VPMDIIDKDLPWPFLRPDVALPLLNVPLGGTGDRRSPTADDVCTERVGRCPRRCCGGPWEAKDELRDIDGRVEEFTGGSLRCRSPPGAKPLPLGLGERSRPSGGATFLNVMVHSRSSPANTVEFFHCTKTRMFEDMVGSTGGDAGCGFGGSSSVESARRHGFGQVSTEDGPGRMVREPYRQSERRVTLDNGRERTSEALRHARPRRVD
jgi:hypothetical protein